MKKDEERHVQTLKEAYRLWGEQQQFRTLYYKTSCAFKETWQALSVNQPCSYYTLSILGDAIVKGKSLYCNKVKAASVMLHVLEFAHSLNPSACPKPSFTFSALSDIAKDSVTIKPAVPTLTPKIAASPRKDVLREKCHISIEESTASDDARALHQELCDNSVNIPNNNIKKEMTMKQKKNSENKNYLKKVVQIDFDSLKVIDVWPSVGEAQRACGIRNIARAINNHSNAGGFYWCNDGEQDSFKPKVTCRKHTRRKSIPEKEIFKDKRKGITETLPAVIMKSFDLSLVSDDDLINEIRRRGWKGDLDVVKRVTL